MLPRPVLAALAAVSLAVGLGLPSVASPDRPRDRAATGSERAQAALAEVRSIFDGDRTSRQALRHGRDATLALRDLAQLRRDLSGQDRERADAFLARPTDANDPQGDDYANSTDPRRECSLTVCLHWVDTTSDAPNQTDTDGDTIPNFVETTLATVTDVHDDLRGSRLPAAQARRHQGRRCADRHLPRRHRGSGPLRLLHVATTRARPRYDVWAYCVLDNDYAADEFPTNTPLENMRVTAAHEYMHAVQFAYDAFEDGWLMEATATWAEDELFDGVDDNVQYLPSGPLGKPRVPLDLSTSPHWYGDWIFFRYLTERFPTELGTMPSLVRDIWQRADAAPEDADEYSLQAVKNALADRGASLRRTFARFADANRRARTTYEEGAANDYPTAPAWFSATLTPGDRSTDWNTVQLDHLASATARYVPSSTMTANDWRLRVRVDMADSVRGSQAVVTVRERDGGVSTSFVSLDADGEGLRTVAFDRDEVTAVEVTLVNASDRTNCWVDQDSLYSCLGDPLDDNLDQRVRGIAYR